MNCNFDRIDPKQGAVLFSKSGKVCGAHPLYKIEVEAGKAFFLLCHEHKLTLDLAGIRAKITPTGVVVKDKARGGCNGFRRHNFERTLKVCRRCGKFREGKPSYAFLLQTALLFAARQCLIEPYALWSQDSGPLVQAFEFKEDGETPDHSKPKGFAAAVLKFVDGYPAYTGPLQFALAGEPDVKEIMAQLGEAVKLINEYEREHPFIAPAGQQVKTLDGTCSKCGLVHALDLDCQNKNAKKVITMEHREY